MGRWEGERELSLMPVAPASRPPSAHTGKQGPAHFRKQGAVPWRGEASEFNSSPVTCLGHSDSLFKLDVFFFLGFPPAFLIYHKYVFFIIKVMLVTLYKL